MAGAVVLVFGPGGSGKSTTAEIVSSRLGWHHLEEDSYWVGRGWGAGHGFRTEDEEAQIQQHVLRDITSLTCEGTCVVLDFILYKTPPNPLTAYSAALNQLSISYCTIALRPSVDAIIDRMTMRGRANDLADLDLRRRQAADQLATMSAAGVAPHRTLDSTGLSAHRVGDRCIETIASVLLRHVEQPRTSARSSLESSLPTSQLDPPPRSL